MVLLLAGVLLVFQGPPECSDVRDCRQRANAAAAAADYERFHDLAWRAVQKGKPNDPELMYLLARAQSLSGRPGDALVMLGRLADMGVPTDAATNDDFQRVRALKGWSELEAKIAAIGKPAVPPGARPEAAAPPAAAKTEAPPKSEPRPTKSAESPRKEAPDSSEETLAFSAPRFESAGLAYDAVSRRFIVGDRHESRLVVVDELSHHVTTLVSAASAGFYDAITAFEIDARRGDLWVASVKSAGPDSVLHKLQLVSGRVLEEVHVGAQDARSRIADIAVAADGTILALDAAAGRIFRLDPGSRQMEAPDQMTIPAGARSFALANGHILYVASDEGITRVDLQAKEAAAVKVPRGLDPARVERIRWHDGSLVLVTKDASGDCQIGRARLDPAGRAITRFQILTAARDADPRAVTLSGSLLYYLVGGKDQSTIRRTRLR
ncbi:MAG TPA: hypothetical protein VH458_20650 [Vicinamibacterales bacterium]